jgi:tetratricopeptide (TPR) repeat protein
MDQGDARGAFLLWSAPLGQREDSGLLDAIANLYFREQRLGDADICYERLIRHHPQSALAWYRLGLVRAARGNYRSAADAERIAVGQARGFALAYGALALDLRESQQAAMSDWAAREALRLKPSYAGAWNLLGALEQDSGRWGDALRCFDEALALEPSYPGAWFNLAQGWDGQGRHDLAWKAYGKAIAADPNFAEAYFGRAAIALDRRALDQARRDYQAWVGRVAWAPEAWWGLHRVDQAQGRRAAAAYDLQRYRASMRARDLAQDRLAASGREEPSPFEADPGSRSNFDAQTRGVLP